MPKRRTPAQIAQWLQAGLLLYHCPIHRPGVHFTLQAPRSVI